jgi:hypothetical protein
MIWYRPTRTAAILAVATLAAMLVAGSPDPGAARSNRGASFEVEQSRRHGTPLEAVVALGPQRITIYDADGWILRAPVSSGRTGYETPAGIFSVLQKEAEHHSNLYDDASMPFMERLTWSGIALHAGVLPGHPASHGCIRMPHDFAKYLFDLTKVGMRVIVAPSDIAPARIADPALFKPRPMPLDPMGTTLTARPPEAGGEVLAIVAPPGSASQAPQVVRKALPISVFISRKAQRLYVRQSSEPLFESPVEIRNVDQPIGTHIFTALAYTDGNADLRWNVISMPQGSPQVESGGSERHKQLRRHSDPAPENTAAARAALDRIAISQDSLERISELVSPGSSLIISDEGIAPETGHGTDFVVVMSGEPQGGLKIRRHNLEVASRSDLRHASRNFAAHDRSALHAQQPQYGRYYGTPPVGGNYYGRSGTPYGYYYGGNYSGRSSFNFFGYSHF